MKRFFLSLYLLLLAVTAHAQFEIKGGSTNLLDPRRAGGSAAVSSGAVTSITVRGGGAGYTAAPLVTIGAPPSGTTATATAVLTSGVVTSITVISGGTGYTTPPAISIAPPSGVVSTTPQYAGVANTSATAGAISTAGVTAGRYPKATDTSVPGSPVVTIVLARASFGHSFSSGVPLYMMGEEIQRPTVRWDGVVTAQSYWRSKPVEAGESFTQAYLNNVGGAQPVVATDSVTVTSSSTSSSEVTVASVPTALTDGATLLGRRVMLVNGTTITLASNASQTISSATSVTFSPAPPFYFSKHADRTFASQPGRVTITWVSLLPDTTAPGEVTPTYKFRREVFSVSSGTRQPVRTMYWSEKSFQEAGSVAIPVGRIVDVKPVYNSFVPSRVAVEYTPEGVNPGNVTLAPEQRTVWFDNTVSGTPALHAYNLEGRIFVEYLGAETNATDQVRQFLGADVIEVRRVSEAATVTTHLGEEMRPRNGAAETGDDTLSPRLVSASVPPAHGSYLQANGVYKYYAERLSTNPDDITVYWSEEKDAAIHFLPAGQTPGLAIRWTKLKRNYVLTWPEDIGDYEPVNVTDVGNRTESALQFASTSLPQVVYQDSLEQTPPAEEITLDAQTQRLMVDLSHSTDETSRGLLKFNSPAGPWYVRLFVQSESKLGSPAVPDPDGSGPLTGSPAVYTLNDRNGDGIADYSPTSPNTTNTAATVATVGTRLAPPSSAYEDGGYISEGLCYSVDAYISPFDQGVPAAGQGGIIPVNTRGALTTLTEDNSLTVWWFKRIDPPNDSFQAFYVPAIAARYAVSYPTSPQELVIASGKGIENPGLTPEQSAGSLYVQNDETLPGFNPNEEHALMLSENVYALRDDLNDAATTSQPFVLIAYTDASNRPAMRVAKVVRSTVAYPLSYMKAAGTPMQPPMPLTVMPLPLKADGKVRNTEVPGTDTAAGVGAPGSYTSFTFEDRKGQHWLYRGPHNGGAPTFGMKFYYLSLDGFYVPGAAPQPEPGTIMPFIATDSTDKVAGDAITVTYVPKWPDDPALGANATTLGELRNAETLTLPKAGLPQVRGQTSAQVLYQQSIANSGATAPSVVLQDPTREKVFLFGAPGQLDKLPTSVPTTDYAGRTYFQGLPPHLQNRFYFDPNLGTKGGLVLVGEFIDEIAGEDYLNLNALSNADLNDLKSVCPPDDSINRPKWDAAIMGMKTTLQTWRQFRSAKLKAYVCYPAVAKSKMRLWKADYSNGVSYIYKAVDKVVLVWPGLGYSITPDITFSPSLYQGRFPDTETATAVASVYLPSYPRLTSISVTNKGAYDLKRPDPTITISPPPGNSSIYSIYVRDGGSGYTTAPEVVISPPGGGGRQAKAVATIQGGSITSITLTDAGQGYSAYQPPTVAVPPPPSLLTVDTTLNRDISIQQIASITDPDTAVDTYALSSTGDGTGYVTLVFGNGNVFTDAGDPVVMQIIKVVPDLYPGDLKVLLSSNPLDEQVTLRHSGDYGGKPENFEFEWRYTFPVNGAPPPTPTGDLPGGTNGWFAPSGTDGAGRNIIKVGGSPTAAISTPAVLMADTYFAMRYRKGSSGAWSVWTTPKLVEGWIKRVLAKITPFNQRMTDLFNNAVNTDVSMLTQAGTRWEGDIALNLNNINDAGLIAIYETILNRGKSFTIGSGIDFAASNDALLLAAGYLSDLYTILGNEAYADAANPTISIDDQTTITEVNTSRYSFEGQVASSLDEELGLLRGRDDSASPGTGIAPAYNRLYWNYTRGINSGEVLYAVNYNIQEKTGSSTADGILDAADAQRMFPQGHGDAYGHYLTALSGYYKLLTHPDFTWIPRAEAVTVLGQAVLIDYKDERKFAAAAANLAHTSEQILSLVQRKSYKDDPALGWSHLRDANTVRAWGLDETASRSGQGNYLHWVTGNALLLDNDTAHTGVQKIDRTTVPELNDLVTSADNLQTSADNANAHLNPLGLSPGAIAFDISPTELQAGQSHYEQIYARALRSVLNAKGSFDQAAKMTRLLRNQENQLTDQNTAIVDQEGAFEAQLIEIYGRPYAGDVGPGKTYVQGYTGPDMFNWNIIDRPTDLVSTAAPVSISMRVPTAVASFGKLTAEEIQDSYNGNSPTVATVLKQVIVQPDAYAQYATVRDPSGALGSRPQTGSLQDALLDAEMARVALIEANQQLQVLQQRFSREGELLKALVKSHKDMIDKQGAASYSISATQAAAGVLSGVADTLFWAGEAARDAADAAQETLPKSVGTSTDATAPARGAIKFAGFGILNGFIIGALASSSAAAALNATANGLSMTLEGDLMKIGFDQDELQAAYEFELLSQELLQQHYRFHTLAASLQTANQKVKNLIALGDSILQDRESYRQRAAAVVAGYRTRDLTFRTFRNEALEQYRTLFDLASRYTYLAAKSYDYETGLLGTTEGKAVIASIVASRSLGDLTGGTPQATTSTLGDSGLAGTMARMNADFSVAEGRLGINNPDPYGTLFSLRGELYRITDDPGTTADDDAWQQTLEQAIRPNLLSDPDIARYCMNIKKPNNTPVPGFVLSFSTTIEHGKNFFGLPYAPGDHNYSPSSFSTKIMSVGIVLPGYIGMDPYAIGTPNAGGPNSSDPNALGATPYAYLIPCGDDYMLAPPLGDSNTVRTWTVQDQALPLPYNLGANDFNTTQFFSSDGTLSEQPWILRKHQAFRPVSDPAFFYSSIPAEFTNRRLVGRSVWNGQWKIVIPAYTLLNNEQDGMTRFTRSVKDIKLFLRTYSHSGN